jgi:serine/threonine protein phosphatase PrpC
MDPSTRGRHDAGVVTLELWGTSRAKGAVNEDAYLIDAAHRLFGVFDGLGATSQAALAATLAAQAIQAAYRDRGPDQGCEAERAFLSLAVRGAGTLLAATLEDGLTTASVVKVCDTPDGGATAVICNIGDSRVYRYTTAGELQQCTLDDSAFGADWDLQLRLSETVAPTGLLDYLYFERRHILDRALGQRGDTPRLWETGAEAGDVLVAVTDGVTDNLTFSEARTLLDHTRDGPERAVRHLVEAAYARSRQTSHPRAKIDDITAVAAQVQRAPQPPTDRRA